MSVLDEPTEATRPRRVDLRFERSATHQYVAGLPSLKGTKKGNVKRKTDPIIAQDVYRARNYSDGMVASQEAALENLRYVRKQLEKEERQAKRIQDELYEWNTPRRWTPYNYHDTEAFLERRAEEMKDWNTTVGGHRASARKSYAQTQHSLRHSRPDGYHLE